MSLNWDTNIFFLLFANFKNAFACSYLTTKLETIANPDWLLWKRWFDNFCLQYKIINYFGQLFFGWQTIRRLYPDSRYVLTLYILQWLVDWTLTWTKFLSDFSRILQSRLCWLNAVACKCFLMTSTMKHFSMATWIFWVLWSNSNISMGKNFNFYAVHHKFLKNFGFWHFSPIFVLLKLTCLVTLFDRKLHFFKNSPKCTIWGIFD